MKEEPEIIDLKTFERFNSKGSRVRGASISITGKQKLLALAFNKAFELEVTDYLKQNKYVIFYYDKSKKTVILEFTNNEKEPSILKITHGTVKSIAFTRVAYKFKLEKEKITGKYPIVFKKGNDGKDYFVIDLTKKH